LHQGILRHDPALETTARTTTTIDMPAHREERAAPRSHAHSLSLRRAVIVGALVLAAAVAFAVARSRHHAGTSGAAPAIVANSLAELDPRTGDVVMDTPIGIEPASIALTRTAAWIANRGDRTLVRYDLSTHRPHSIGGLPSPYDVTTDAGGNIWVSNEDSTITWILRPPSGTGTSAVPLETKTIGTGGPSAGAEAVGGGFLWVIANPRSWPKGGDVVSLIDIGSHRVAHSLRLARPATAIGFGDGSAWIGTYDRGRATAWLTAVRAGSAGVRSVRLERDAGWGPLSIAAGAGSVWVVTSAGALVRVDAETERIIKRIPLGAAEPQSVTVGGGFVWVVNHGTFSVSQVDPKTNRVVRTVPLGSATRTVCGIAASRSAVWVAIGDAYCDTANR
jgi:DNA-binding beta-propeller fold protein YncE